MNQNRLPTLRDFPVGPMTEAQTLVLAELSLSKHPHLSEELKLTDLDPLGFIGKVFARRLCAHGVRLQLNAALWTLSLLDSPGGSTMWVWTLFNMQKDPNHIIDLNELVQAFPMGVPEPASFEALWRAQKDVDGSNRLDQPATWSKA